MPSTKKKSKDMANRRETANANAVAAAFPAPAPPSAEDRSAKMNLERAFLTELLESSLAGDGPKVSTMLITKGSEGGVPPHKVLAEFMDGSKRTALHFACLSEPESKGGVEDIVTMLLRNSGFPLPEMASLASLCDGNGMTPLMLACQRPCAGSVGRIRCLLELGGAATAAATSDVGATALHYAAAAGVSDEVVELLVRGAERGDGDHGASFVNLLSSKSGTPLHWAAGCAPGEDRSAAMAALLDRGADVDAPNGGGVAPLVMAAASGNEANCELLIGRGANRGLVLGGGYTVYHIAAEMGKEGTLEALIGADRDDSADTDANPGAETVSAKCLKLETVRGETPLDLAAQGGHLKSVMLLSGEMDEVKAKSIMEEKQKKWQERKAELKAAEEAESNAKHGEVETAEQTAARFLAAAPSTTEAAKAEAATLKASGNSHFGRREWELAASAYAGAASLDPGVAAIHSNRSAALAKLGRSDEALRDAEIARCLRPEWAKARYRVAVARAALGRYEDAAVAAFEGLELDENNEELKALLKKCIAKGRKAHLEDANNKKEKDNDAGGGEGDKVGKKEKVLALVP